MAIGWLSPNLPKLQSNETPLQSGPMTLSETSWIGSCFSIGAIVGNCVFGILSNYIGRKNTLCILALPNLVNIFMTASLLLRSNCVISVPRFVVLLFGSVVTLMYNSVMHIEFRCDMRCYF